MAPLAGFGAHASGVQLIFTRWKWVLALLLYYASVGGLWAGGSGLNVAVVVNQSSTNSVQLGNYYCEQRQVPPQNLLRIDWPGGNTDWTVSDFNIYLLNPALSMLADHQLTNQIDYFVLSMDIPYRVIGTSDQAINSTTSSLFYGFKHGLKVPPAEECNIASDSTNRYAGSEGIFRSTPPIDAASNSFLVTMITASNLPLAKLIVDQGVRSDYSCPTQTTFLAKSTDGDRNVRYLVFDNAIFNNRLHPNFSLQRIEAAGLYGLGAILGFQSGSYNYSASGASFVPGAMADNLTSFGGVLFADNSFQLNILSLLALGAAGTYGTVDEPCNYLQKFPASQNYFYQARGFSLAECYYQSVTNPYQGLILGEPLAQPFAQPPTGSWSGLPANALLAGTTNLTLQLQASDAAHPVQQVDLFIDGVWTQTLTNIAPRQNNVITVTLNGHSLNYTVPGSATLKSVGAGLGELLNNKSNLTKVAAVAYGDRVELQSLDNTQPGAEVSLAVSNSPGSASSLTTLASISRTNFLDTIAFARKNFQIAGNPILTSSLQLTVTKTNGTQATLSVSNSGSQSLSNMVARLVNLVNTDSRLTGPDGVTAGDLVVDALMPVERVEFNLNANSLGWGAAGIQANLSGLTFLFSTSGNVPLDDNLGDLRPRNHLYLTAGVTNLPLSFVFDTTRQADGFHELAAVVYEGSHVRTQKRLPQSVRIQNSSLAATFVLLSGDTNTALEASVPLGIVANTNNIAKIELFSTGGLLGSVTGQSNALFSVAGTNLGAGLHPFYALVTSTAGNQYRTETKWVRFVGADAESPFRLALTSPPVTLAWPATVGGRYEILSTTNLSNPFSVRAAISPTNSLARWTDPDPTVSQRFYRVRTAN